MIRRPPRSTLFPTRRSSDLRAAVGRAGLAADDGHLRRRGEDGPALRQLPAEPRGVKEDRKSTRLNSSHTVISYAVFCLKKKKKNKNKNTKNQHIETTRSSQH